jgi:hypothetical protein
VTNDFEDQAQVDLENDRRAERDEEREMRAATAPDDTPPVCGACGDRDPFCCDGQARAVEQPAQPDPAELLRREYRRVDRALYEELLRHRKADGCGIGADCDLYCAIQQAWGAAYDMAQALDWLLGDWTPEDEVGRPRAGWVPEFVAGPWPDPTLAHEQFMARTRALLERTEVRA